MPERGDSVLHDISAYNEASDETLHGHREKTAQEQAEQVELDYPDGGLRAWAVVFGASCFAFSTFGVTHSFGVFQAYYQQTLLPTTSPSAIAWIGSIQYALIFLPALPMGRLLDLGYFNIPVAVSGLCYIVTVFLVAECKKYWQLLLGQGVTIGVFAGLLFGPTPGVVAHWFMKKRFSAMAGVAVGSSIGGTILPIVTRKLLSRVGYRWTIRILAFILLVTVLVGNLLVRRRMPPRNVKGGLFNWADFKKPQFALYVLGCNAVLLGLYVPLTYLDISAQNAGISAQVSFYFISIANVGSLIGRVGGGLLADRFGALNVLIPFTTMAAIMTYTWPHATSIGPLAVVALIYGICSGAFISLLPGAPSKMGGMEDVGRRIGMVSACSAPGAIAGPPIAGAIRTSSGSFNAVGAYAGSMILGGALLMVAVRRVHLGAWKGKF